MIEPLLVTSLVAIPLLFSYNFETLIYLVLALGYFVPTLLTVDIRKVWAKLIITCINLALTTAVICFKAWAYSDGNESFKKDSD